MTVTARARIALVSRDARVTVAYPRCAVLSLRRELLPRIGVGSWLALAGACGGLERDTPEVYAPDTPIPVSALVTSIRHDVCRRAVECKVDQNYVSVADCERSIDFSAAVLENSIERGAVVYDAEALAVCRQRYLEDLCGWDEYAPVTGDLFATLATCPGALQPQLQRGDACSRSAECASGLRCDRAAGCPGICTRALGLGAACQEHDDCEPSLQCGEEGRCSPVQHVGTPCDGECLCLTHDCPPDIWCNEEAGRCELGVGLGETCATRFGEFVGAPCREGLWCHAPVYGSSGVCRAPSGDGQPCDPTEPISCEGDLVCRLRSRLDSDPVCLPPLGRGGSCVNGFMCGPGLACAYGCELVCYPGYGCDQECRFGSPDRHGICQFPALLGEPCDSFAICAVGECVEGRCADVSCGS